MTFDEIDQLNVSEENKRLMKILKRSKFESLDKPFFDNPTFEDFMHKHICFSCDEKFECLSDSPEKCVNVFSICEKCQKKEQENERQN